MPYTLTQAANVLAIAECEYGTAQEIMFTKFTSCIGVLAKVKNEDKVIGIHLVLVDSSNNTFGVNDVAKVTQVLTNQNYDPTTVIILGKISFWETSAGAAYTALARALNPVKVYRFDDGTYGAKIDDDHAIEILY